MEYYTDPKRFLLKAGKIGILLIHGMACNAAEMRGVGDYLYSKGITVLAVCLPGHGTTYHDLSNIKYTEWINHVHTELNELKKICDTVFILGKSLGGLLTLEIASTENIKGAVVISPPFFNTFLIYPLLLLFSKIKKSWTSVRHYKRDIYVKLSNKPPYTIAYYPTLSLKTIIEVFKTSMYVRKNISTVKIPILIIQGKKDPLIPKNAGKILFNSINYVDKKLVYFENSAHTPIVENEREKVWEEIYKFITTHE